MKQVLVNQGQAHGVADVYWLPIECVIDVGTEANGFSRFMSTEKLKVLIDSCNPLYIRPANMPTVLSNALSDEGGELELIDTVSVEIPSVEAFATSLQYSAAYDVIAHVLVYADPDRMSRFE